MSDSLKDAQNSLKIKGVNLKESRIFVRDNIELDSIELEETKKQSFRTVLKIREVLIEIESRKFYEYRFAYSSGIRLIFSNEEDESFNDEYQPIIEIIGVFDATYISKTKVKKTCLEAFAEHNVGYHVWPYWREYVQSTCSRIGFYPAFNVPFYLLPLPGDIQEDQSSHDKELDDCIEDPDNK